MITKYDIRATDFNSATKKELVELSCKSTDTLPTTGIMNGSLAMEVDTGKIYAFDEAGGEWNEIGSSGGGGGGGGSSDFSTAEVTFSGTDGTLASMPLIISTPFDAILPLKNEVSDETYMIALYKGKAVINVETEGLGTTITPSGDIELLEGGTYLVTGNGTITIS